MRAHEITSERQAQVLKQTRRLVLELGLRPPDPARAEVFARRLAENDSATDLGEMIAALTSGHTLFFRDVAQLHAGLDQLQLAVANAPRPARVWCAGCSSGEEAYTLAMLAHERGVNMDVLGSDIDASALEHARGGRYSANALRQVPPRSLEHFQADGDHFVVREHLRRRVRFVRHNLLSATPVQSDAGLWDLIVCRNVLLYYRREVALRVIAQLDASLRPGGLLVLGSVDLLIPNARATLERVADTSSALYRRRVATSCPPTDSPRRLSPPPTHRDTDLYCAAMREVDAGNHGRALELLARRLCLYPNDARAHLSRGNILLFAHRFQEAEQHYQQALTRAELAAEAHFLRGLSWRKQGRVEQAISDFRACLFLDSGFWPAAYLLAGSRERLGQKDLSRRAWTLALELLERDLGSPFRSRVEGLPGLSIDPGEAIELCRRRLAAL